MTEKLIKVSTYHSPILINLTEIFAKYYITLESIEQKQNAFDLTEKLVELSVYQFLQYQFDGNVCRIF